MATQRQIASLRAPHATFRSTWTPEDIVALRQFLLASQEEFAERLGTRQQRVSEWECGKHTPHGMSARLLDLLAHETGFDVRVRPLAPIALTTSRHR